MRYLVTKLWWVVALLILVAYGWNVYRYDVWSSYDGGGHLEYAVQLGEGRGLPNPQKNYLAWHEPGYYWVVGVGSRLVGVLDWPKPELYKLWQYGSAVLLWSGAVAAGLLAWQVSRRRDLAWFTGLVTASLFSWSALARYVTNEGAFQVGVLWWLVWFEWWRMDQSPQWSRVKWVLLSLGLAGLLWVKLTAVVLIGAVVLWLLVQRGATLKVKLKWVVVVIIIPAILYTPWLYHKQKLYGQAFTINSYEEKNATRMPLSFFYGWDSSVLTTPFWISGRGSFASMLVASALVDYDNIFEAYDRPASTDLITGNGRRLSESRAMASVQLVRWSAGLGLWLIVGLILLGWQLARGRVESKVQLLATVAFGFLLALMYNVWRYPYLERGTLKAIFIAAAFPLLGIIAQSAWQQTWPQRSRWITGVTVLYWLIWLILAWRIGLLPR